MVDSENSRTSPSITRRNLLSVATAALAACETRPLFDEASTPQTEAPSVEPVIQIWQQWFAAHKRRAKLCRLQQRLETKLFEILRNLPDHHSAKARNAADKEIGYSRAYQAETEASNRETALAKALWKAPAQSIPGVIAKLHSVIEMEDPDGRLKETPWLELRLILTDLIKIKAD